jgi:predicted nucleic acid-binding protein
VTLCDAGPLVAIVDTDDQHHAACVAAMALLPPRPLVTTWPCLTEAMYLLFEAGGLRAQNRLWQHFVDGRVELCIPASGEWQRIRELMNQYADMPLDMADASLIYAAEKMGESRLFTIDRLLGAVQLANGQYLQIVP